MTLYAASRVKPHRSGGNDVDRKKMNRNTEQACRVTKRLVHGFRAAGRAGAEDTDRSRDAEIRQDCLSCVSGKEGSDKGCVSQVGGQDDHDLACNGRSSDVRVTDNNRRCKLAVAEFVSHAMTCTWQRGQ